MLNLAALPVLAIAAAAMPQDARAILATAQARQAERWETVDDYAVVRRVNGMESVSWYRKFTVEGQPLFREVPRTEWERERTRALGGTVLSSGDLEVHAQASEQVGDAMASEMARQGVPPIPGLDFRKMMGDQALFLRAGAAYEENDGRSDAAETARGLADFAGRARVAGREDVDGRSAFHLRAEDLSDVPSGHPAGDARFTLRSVSLWIDTEEYVPLRLRVEGAMEADGEVRDVVIEKLDQAYERAGPLYESRRQVMRISGLLEGMSPEDRKKMAKARADIEKMEAQMDQIPQAARGMVARQMEKAKAQLALMSDEGAFEAVVEVIRVVVNGGPPEGRRGLTPGDVRPGGLAGGCSVSA
jgi:hypothetical protein